MMKEIADLITALSTLLWPIFAFVIIQRYKDEIRDVLRRLKRGKLLGQELELDKSLDQLALEANAAAAQLPELPAATAPAQLPEAETDQNDAGTPPAQRVTTVPAARLWSDDSDPVEDVLKLASLSPKLGLMRVSAAIDKEVRRHLATTGRLDQHRGQLLKDLASLNSSLPSDIIRVVHEFQNVRNKIVHGHEANKDDILRAIDSGLTILRAIKKIPVTQHVVYHPNVELYADAAGHQPRVGVHGVLLDNYEPQGARGMRQIFPTKCTHFAKGKAVAWEWDLSTTWDETWYRDPDTGEIMHGWSSAGEFIGRNLDEI